MKRMRSFWKNTWKNRGLVIASLPVIVLLIMFSYIPMFGILVAFKDYNYQLGIFGSPWNGLENFRLLTVSKNLFWQMTRNTVGYWLLFTVVGVVFQILLAIGINEFISKKLGKFFHSCMVLPAFITYIAITFIVFAFLDRDTGLLNRVIEAFGGDPVSWYMEAKYWPVILLIVNMWKGSGYGAVIYLATLTGIDQELYEAAALDGANARQRMWHITLPMLVPVATLMILLSLGGVMHSDTGLFYQVTKNMATLKSTTRVLDSYVLNAMMTSTDYGVTSAVTFYQSVIGFVLVMVTNAIVRKIAPENALF